MNTRMWNNPVVQRHIKTLTDMEIKLIGPASGRLACGTEGLGRMAEPDEIIAAIETL
jgi:phosphopantothenoylcysteine decarboxylase/phosphopantothenate--cysteine ligase